jgi:hypothetical protein
VQLVAEDYDNQIAVCLPGQHLSFAFGRKHHELLAKNAATYLSLQL